MLEALDAVVEVVLHVLRQAAGGALQIHLLGVLAAGFHKDGVPVLARKPHHLILDGGTVAGPHPLDHPPIEGAAVDVVQNDPVGGGVGVGDVAIHQVAHRLFGHKAEGLQGLLGVAGLALQFCKFDAPPVHPGGGAGLEPAQGQAQLPQAVGEGVGGVHPIGTRSVPGIPHKDLSPQVGAGGDHHAAGGVLPVQLGDHSPHPAPFGPDGHYLGLMDGQAGGPFQGVLHPDIVAAAVGLHPQGVDGGALAPVEHPALEGGGVGGQAHKPAQSVHFPHQSALGRPSDAGVAGHIAHGVQAHGKDRGAGSQPGGRVGGLDPRMARADHDHVIVSKMVHPISFLITCPHRTVRTPGR